MRLCLVALAAFLTFAVGSATATHAPEGIRLIRHSAKTVTVGWNTVQGVTGYGLFVDGTQVATAGAAATQARFGTPQYRQYVLGVSALKTGGAMSTITVDPRWVAVSTFVPPEPNPPPNSPTVTITSGPQNPTTLTSAVFAWSSTNATSFTCKLDTAAAAACTSPVTYTVAVGTHTFVVTASGAGGTATATANWTVQTTVPPPTGNVTLTPVDGGSSYYGQFSNTAGMDAPGYFPIAVWGAYNQTTANMNLDASAGINTYVWAADSSLVPAIRTDGRFKVIQDEGSRANVGTETAGWLLGDEWDMTGESCPGQVNTVKSTLPNDGRMRYFNFGKGLALAPGGSNFWSDATEQNCFANSVDLDSVDMYWFTDPWQGDFCCAYKYGDNIRNLRNADNTDGNRHPHWSFVETGDPWDASSPGPLRSITPAEVRGAVWHSLIAGARGIVYFEHSFRGPCIGDHHTIRTNCEGTRPIVTSVDAQIKSLAPVLNSPTVTAGFTANASVKAMAKWDGSNFYLFTGNAGTAATTGTFSIPCVGNATATVVDENRSVTVGNGSFTDGFADGNTIHIYRVDGGGRCGL